MSFFSQILLAQGKVSNPVLGGLGKLSGSQFFQRLLPALVTMGFVLGALIFLSYFIIGAIELIRSGGDKVATQSAKDRITTSLIGIFILFSLFAIINLIELFFGIDITYFDLNILRVY